MKKLFALVVLSGLPVACGTSLPSTPGDVAATGGDESVVSLARKGRVRPCTGDENLIGIQIGVIDSSASGTTVRAYGVFAPEADDAIAFSPSWSAINVRDGQFASILVSKDPQEATLAAKPGQYQIVSSYTKCNGKTVESSIVIELR